MFDKIEGHTLDEIIEVVEEDEAVVKTLIRKPHPLPPLPEEPMKVRKIPEDPPHPKLRVKSRDRLRNRETI